MCVREEKREREREREREIEREIADRCNNAIIRRVIIVILHCTLLAMFVYIVCVLCVCV